MQHRWNGTVTLDYCEWVKKVLPVQAVGKKQKCESHIERGVNGTSRPFLETWFDIEFDQVHFKDCVKSKSAHGIHLSQVNMENSLYCFAWSQQRPLLLPSKRNHFIIWGRFECFKTVKFLHQVVSYLRPQYRLQIFISPYMQNDIYNIYVSSSN